MPHAPLRSHVHAGILIDSVSSGHRSPGASVRVDTREGEEDPRARANSHVAMRHLPVAFGMLVIAFAVVGSRTPAVAGDPIARWFDAGRCAAFEVVTLADTAPVLKRDSDGVMFDRVTANTRGYFYDPKSRAALYYPETDSAGTFTLQVSGPPPPGVPQHDLSTLHTASGIRLGSSAASVVAHLGAPKIVNGCGLRRYLYQRSREGEPTSLQFTIRSGRVVEIFEEFGG